MKKETLVTAKSSNFSTPGVINLINKKKPNKLSFSKRKKTLEGPKKYDTAYSKLSEVKLITIGLASPEKIRQWAEKTLPKGKILGQVINANTLHHKTFKPQKGGLFCERIFGPLKDFQCACGTIVSKPLIETPSGSPLENLNSNKEVFENEKTSLQEKFVSSKDQNKNEIPTLQGPKAQRSRRFCKKCDVEYTWSVIRRYQLGYIELVSPVTHLWYLKGSPSYLSILLDMKKRHIEYVTYCTESLTLENSIKGINQNRFNKIPSQMLLNWETTVRNVSLLRPNNTAATLKGGSQSILNGVYGTANQVSTVRDSELERKKQKRLKTNVQKRLLPLALLSSVASVTGESSLKDQKLKLLQLLIHKILYESLSLDFLNDSQKNKESLLNKTNKIISVKKLLKKLPTSLYLFLNLQLCFQKQFLIVAKNKFWKEIYLNSLKRSLKNQFFLYESIFWNKNLGKLSFLKKKKGHHNSNYNSSVSKQEPWITKNNIGGTSLKGALGPNFLLETLGLDLKKSQSFLNQSAELADFAQKHKESLLFIEIVKNKWVYSFLNFVKQLTSQNILELNNKLFTRYEVSIEKTVDLLSEEFLATFNRPFLKKSNQTQTLETNRSLNFHLLGSHFKNNQNTNMPCLVSLIAKAKKYNEILLEVFFIILIKEKINDSSFGLFSERQSETGAPLKPLGAFNPSDRFLSAKLNLIAAESRNSKKGKAFLKKLNKVNQRLNLFLPKELNSQFRCHLKKGSNSFLIYLKLFKLLGSSEKFPRNVVGDFWALNRNFDVNKNLQALDLNSKKGNTFLSLNLNEHLLDGHISGSHHWNQQNLALGLNFDLNHKKLFLTKIKKQYFLLINIMNLKKSINSQYLEGQKKSFNANLFQKPAPLTTEYIRNLILLFSLNGSSLSPCLVLAKQELSKGLPLSPNPSSLHRKHLGSYLIRSVQKMKKERNIKKQNLPNKSSKLVNQIYTLSHRERWMDEEWQNFIDYMSVSSLKTSFLNNKNKQNNMNFNSLENLKPTSPSSKDTILMLQKSQELDLSNTGEIGKEYNLIPAYQNRIFHLNIDQFFRRSINLQQKNKNGINPVGNNHAFFSGPGIIQQLLNEFDFSELQKIDKQNRILLYQLNKHIFSLKKRLSKSARKELKECYKKRDQLIRRTKLIRTFFRKDSKPNSMILTILPVLPPDLRPIVKIGGQVAASDLNRLYQRVIYRNDRLKKFLKEPATSSSYEMKYAQRLLQEAVDNLIQNGKSGTASEKDARGRALKSLSDLLKGKQGRFRQYLLGKRVDYSGRSVIVVGPKLQLHECGLPKEMALELYFPFLLKRLINHNYARTVVGAKTLMKKDPDLTWELLKEIMQTCPILLNRAPTLHRLGIQAFQPKLIEGRAILLHPLVCPAFNADFDGDQMAVHVPITIEARAEAWKLMCARQNFLSPATGEPLAIPSQDMVLGCYYLTTHCNKSSIKNQKGSGFSFSDFSDVLNAYRRQIIDLHAFVWVKFDGHLEQENQLESTIELRINSYGNWNEIYQFSQKNYSKNQNLVNQYICTTPGRIIFNFIVQKTLFGFTQNLK
jgi:DNA-directed RNA polymerase beta' subunit